jgi:hypothetical protein
MDLMSSLQELLLTEALPPEAPEPPDLQKGWIDHHER